VITGGVPDAKEDAPSPITPSEGKGKSKGKGKDKESAASRPKAKPIRVVTAFENYAFDAGMRVGDELLSVDGKSTKDLSTSQVRDLLRGDPGTSASVTFSRAGLPTPQTLSLPRSIVKIRDVKLTSFVGNPDDAIGYVSLSGFSADAGREVRASILALQKVSESQSSTGKLEGLILDLRGNPGGLLTSAVDVASLLVPKGSDIVSAKGRGFPSVVYRSRASPLLSPDTKLVVLVNANTASAAEIVSGAVQDLDVGVILGGDRTYGKGLVQNVEVRPTLTRILIHASLKR
jgi:carboxyl-terminal processing protease